MTVERQGCTRGEGLGATRWGKLEGKRGFGFPIRRNSVVQSAASIIASATGYRGALSNQVNRHISRWPSESDRPLRRPHLFPRLGTGVRGREPGALSSIFPPATLSTALHAGPAARGPIGASPLATGQRQASPRVTPPNSCRGLAPPCTRGRQGLPRAIGVPRWPRCCTMALDAPCAIGACAPARGSVSRGALAAGGWSVCCAPAPGGTAVSPPPLERSNRSPDRGHTRSSPPATPPPPAGPTPCPATPSPGRQTTPARAAGAWGPPRLSAPAALWHHALRPALQRSGRPAGPRPGHRAPVRGGQPPVRPPLVVGPLSRRLSARRPPQTGSLASLPAAQPWALPWPPTSAPPTTRSPRHRRHSRRGQHVVTAPGRRPHRAARAARPPRPGALTRPAGPRRGQPGGRAAGPAPPAGPPAPPRQGPGLALGRPCAGGPATRPPPRRRAPGAPRAEARRGATRTSPPEGPRSPRDRRAGRAAHAGAHRVWRR